MPVIAHNMLSQFSERQLNITDKNKSKSSEKLSSGYRVNCGADDAAGLAISEKLRWQVRGLDRASQNIRDGMSLLNVADGALVEVHSMLRRMNELVIQAANDSNSYSDRDAIQQEINLLVQEIEQISTDTTFNTMPVFNGENVQTADTVNDLTLSLPLGTNVAINSSNIDLLLNRNADGSYELQDGHTYTFDRNITNATFHIGNGATVSVQNTILNNVAIVCDSAKLYLSNVSIVNENISLTYPKGFEGAPITCKGSTTINYLGTNYFRGTRYSSAQGGPFKDYAGIQVDAGNSLILNGNGSLEASGSNLAAGIGSGWISSQTNNTVSGNITIHSGYINAYSTQNGAGIGGCYEGVNGNIVIDGGSVHASSWESGAGIGTGAIILGTPQHGGSVMINGGTVEAVGGQIDGGAGIGGGFGSHGVNVTISDGTVTAKGGAGGAGIGSGKVYNGIPLISGDITLSGGNVTAVGSTATGGITPATHQGAAIGVGSFHPIGGMTDQDWLDGFGTLTMDGVIGDMHMEGCSAKDGVNYIFSYKGAVTAPQPPQTDTESGAWWIQMGAASGNGIFISTGKISPADLKIDNLEVLSHEKSGFARTNIQNAIDKVSSICAHIGVQYNRLEYGQLIDDNTAENSQSAESRIRDTDMAAEMVNHSRHSILQQAGQSMLSQANQIPEGVLRLLQ